MLVPAVFGRAAAVGEIPAGKVVCVLCFFVPHHLVLTGELVSTSVALKWILSLSCICDSYTFCGFWDFRVHKVAFICIKSAGSLGKVSTISRVLLFPVLHHAVVVWELIGTIPAFKQTYFCVFHRHGSCSVSHFNVFQELLLLNG